MRPVGAQGPGGVDLAAGSRDDQLLDLLAARAGVPADASHDPAVVMLAALAEDVDDGLAELLAEAAERESAAAELSELSGVRRGRGLRVTSMALVVGATLSVSGVAAAVTGDPLAPYKGLVSVVAGEDQLPEQAARVAALNHALRGTRAQIAHGDLAAAHTRLDALKARLSSMTGLSHGERAALEARIAALEAALARAEAKSLSDRAADPGRSSEGSRPTGAGKPEDTASSGSGKDSAGVNVQPGQHGTGADVQKARPTKEPHASTGQQADEQDAVSGDTSTTNGTGDTDATATADPDATATPTVDPGGSSSDEVGSGSEPPGSSSGGAQGQRRQD